MELPTFTLRFILDPYITSGFMALQMAIENSFVNMWKNTRLPPIGESLTVARYPFYKIDFLVMPNIVRPNINIIYYMTVLAFLLLPIATLQKMIHDKETGFRGLMRLMNMSFSIMYLGWLNYMMITALPVAIACTLLLHPIFTNAYRSTIFLFIIMYITLSTLVVFTFGTFFRSSVRAVLMSLSFWLFLTHFTIVLDQFLVTASLTWRIVSLVLPHSGLLYGIVAFTSGAEIDEYLAESLISFLSATGIPSYKSPTPPVWPRKISDVVTLNGGSGGSGIIHIKEKVSVDMVLTAWCIHIVIWYFVSIYFENINPGQYWSTRPWYFLCKGAQPKDLDFEFKVKGSTNWSAVERTPSFIKGRDFNEDLNIANLFGYCPQQNILVNYMTVVQHLYMFGMMKDMTYKEAYADALKLIKKLGLESVKNTKSKSLSIGYQRRINLGMALIGKSQILILDEPTYGIDAEHRRQIWDLLLEIKRKKTILLATNSMEAADCLADRIAIIANGMVECYGSKMYLHRRYGIGYVLSLLISEKYDLNLLRTEIQEFSSEPITLRGIIGLVVRFDVPKQSRFTKLLQYLDSNKERLKIVSVTLSAAGIEGQFLRIGLASQFKERGVQYPSKQYELIVQKRRRDLLANAKPWQRLSGKNLWHQQTCAMFYKKFLHVAAFWKLYLFSITLATITLVLGMMIGELSSFEIFDKIETTLNLADYVDNNFHVLYYAADSEIADSFLIALYKTGRSYSEKGTYHVSRNITAAELMIHPDLHSIEFRDRCVMSVDIQANGAIDLMYSSTIIHSGPIALNLLNNAILRYHCGFDCDIKLKSNPLVEPKKWQHQFIHPRSVRNWENAAIIATLFLVLPTIDLGVTELNSLSKMMQMNTIGVTTLMYWGPIYIVDLLIYTVSIVFLVILFVFAYSERMKFLDMNVAHVLYIFVGYGACAIPFNYCIQLFTRKPEKVYLIVILINVSVILLLNGSLIFPAILRLFNDTGRYFLEMWLHTIPSYVLTCALSNYLILCLYNKKCSDKNTCDTEAGIEDPCCQNCGEEYCYKPFNAMMTIQSGQEYFHSVIDDLLVMISATVALHLILHIFEEKNRRKWYNFSLSNENDNDKLEESVTNEKNQVKKHMKYYKENNSLPPHVVLAVQDLRKIYGKRPVVRGVNFNVYYRDSFGLLGINNAGKSVIFDMLLGRRKISAGKAVMFEYDLAKNQDMIRGLNDFMTGRQHLILFAALRGIPFKSIIDEVDKWLDVLDLLDFENMRIEYCPWGVRKKMCILQSLIGDLPMIMMDEPTAGIDVIARQAVCDILHQVRESGRSLLIITHNMQYAEATCLRVGILVKGQFVVIDSCEQLKRKHGNNYIMSISVRPTLQNQYLMTLKNIVDEKFPGIKLKDFHLGILQYELESDIAYSNVFDILEQLRQRYPWITDFTVNQSSMDHVFFDIVKKHEVTTPEQLSWKRRFINWFERFKRRNESRTPEV
ncbi:hypothetical protein KPH14_003774 [Odynerus spinipes]|uniref:ABC transporter domain-containing protein n=1 Tax=Odynerus spinipes TaxID=1348599 RepID=A0AAD9RXN0_9HYME|nr:hypothetical protein KPH14_003774 [Odynerus spinipes]